MKELTLPRTVAVSGRQVELRLMTLGDADAILAFANTIAPHDLLFLNRDIRNPKVVAAWEDQIAQGPITSVLALHDARVYGCTAVVRDLYSWSAHVSEIRVVIGDEMRGTGLGRLLAQECLVVAAAAGASKVFVRATVDQVAALAVFQDLGFVPEALLREHVRDPHGQAHDIAILSLDLARQEARHENYGFENVGG